VLKFDLIIIISSLLNCAFVLDILSYNYLVKMEYMSFGYFK